MKHVPLRSTLTEKLGKTVSQAELNRSDYRSITEAGKKLPDILLGKVHPLSVLFPDGSQMTIADDFYETLHTIVTNSLNLLLHAIISRYIQGAAHVKSGKVRILEVGAGTGKNVLVKEDIYFYSLVRLSLTLVAYNNP